MERRVSVNAGTILTVTPDGLPQGWSETTWSAAEPIAEGREYGDCDTGLPGQGPCLYLGPRGERCRRAGRASGFCVAHEPRNRTTKPARVAAAAAVIVVLLWPYLEIVIREVIGWARSR